MKYHKRQQVHCCFSCCCYCLKAEYHVGHCGSQTNTPLPQRCPHFNLWNLWINYVPHQREIKDAVGIRIAIGLSKWVKCNHRVIKITRGKPKGVSQRKVLTLKEGHREMKCCWFTEDGGRGPLVKECGWLLEAGETKEIFFPRFRKEHNPANTLGFLTSRAVR